MISGLPQVDASQRSKVVVLPDTDHLPLSPGLRDRVLKLIGGNEPRAYKDAKLTLVWPVWHDAFPEATWVLVRRDKERIVDSCLRTAFMWSYSERLGWRQWVEAHERRFARMRKHLHLVEVWTDTVVDDPGAFFPVAEICGLPMNLEAVEAAVGRKQWHGAA
jgi:hypothetical protein